MQRTFATRVGKLALETLEARSLMAAGISNLSPYGVVTMTGTDLAETATVGYDNRGTPAVFDDMVTFKMSNEIRTWERSFPAWKVDVTSTGEITFGRNVLAMSFYGHGQNDTFENKTNIRCVAIGGEGHDTLKGGGGNDWLAGDNGLDYLFGGNGQDVLHGGAGSDTLNGGNGNDEMYGEDGADVLNEVWSTGDDYMEGGGGNDRLYDGNGNDILWGNDGHDQIYKNWYEEDNGKDVYYVGFLDHVFGSNQGGDKSYDVSELDAFVLLHHDPHHGT